MGDTKPLRILILTTEAVPFTNVGELGETIPPLAAALRAAGHEVRLILPRYYFINRDQLTLRHENLSFAFNGMNLPFSLFEDRLPSSGIPVLFVECEEFFGRDGVYGPAGGGDFPDNASRFACFGRAAFAACLAMDWIPDVLHAHDWPGAPAVAFLDLEQRYGPFAACASLLTIHDIAFQGLFPADHFRFLDLGPDEFRPGGFEFFGRLNLMQGGLRHSQLISTISPSYAIDITTERFGFGMEGILRERQADLHGILNGLDYQRWDPATDTRLPHNYSSGSLAGREACKRELQSALGLQVDPDKTIMAMISRLDSYKGFIEVMAPACLPRLLEEAEVQVIIIGSGDTPYGKQLQHLAVDHPNLVYRTWCPIDYLPQVLSAADFFLAPPVYEPSAFNTLLAMRYGAIPVLSPAGALRDVVRDDPAHPDMATGLLINTPARPEAIHAAVMRAIALHHDPVAYHAMQTRIMDQRFTWDDCAGAYLMLYRTAMDRRRSDRPSEQPA